MKTLQERIEWAFSRKTGAKKNALAKAAGVEPPSVSDWFNGKTLELKGRSAIGAARYLGVNVEWLASGKGRPEDASKEEPPFALSSATPDIQARVLELLGKLTPPQQEQVVKEMEALVATNESVLRHLGGKRLRTTEDSRIEATFGVVSKDRL